MTWASSRCLDASAARLLPGWLTLMRDIAAKIGAKISAGLLPLATEPRQRIGRGSGCSCAACDESITRADIEYEVTLGNRRMLHFHPDCLTVWKDGRYDAPPGNTLNP